MAEKCGLEPPAQREKHVRGGANHASLFGWLCFGALLLGQEAFQIESTKQ